MDVSSGFKESLAIVGIGCRFPGGANSPDEFWRLIANGVDAITEVPADRWNASAFYDADPNRPGKTYTRWGGFIQGIDQFDAGFFGISPKEAADADPQQRLLLEVGYEAIEDAGLRLEDIAGTSVGVFIGVASEDYSGIQLSTGERHSLDAYTNLGSSKSITANRISYAFDLRGPSFAIDSACSSSLVAIHLACQSLWSGECSLALTGGVNILIRPETTIAFSKASMLSPSGRCRAFDVRADGFVRAEGAGVVLLKPLAQALADHDTIYALVRGSAVNQDGRTNGITVPSQAAQELMLEQAYAGAAIPPERVQYFEAHGTGTRVGDPIELAAVAKVIGSRRRMEDGDCFIGSVKTNVGHLETGSGVAGVIKAALCLHHREIVPSLHFQEPTEPLEPLHLRVAAQRQPWPDNNGYPRVAGVNSFGFGGTNAHVVLQEAPTNGEPRRANVNSNGQSARLFVFSARSSTAREATCRNHLSVLQNGGEGEGRSDGNFLDNLSYSLLARRSHHDFRLAVAAKNEAELAASLQAFLDGETRPSMVAGTVLQKCPAPIAFVFTGMGPQWAGMGKELLASERVFREKAEQCDAAFRRLAGWSILQELLAEPEQSRIQETRVAQPAIFVLQVALAELWKSWGVVPEAVIGHSVGEVAAAYTSGVLSLEDAVSVIFHRSRLQQTLAGRGGMLAVGVPYSEAEELVKDCGGHISVAAINSPGSVTLSGEQDILEQLSEQLTGREVLCTFLRVEVAYHSPQMESVRKEFLDSIRNIRPRAAELALYSTVLGECVNGSKPDADYWYRNLRHTVLFAPAVERMMAAGYTTFIEIGPHPALANSLLECARNAGAAVESLASLRRREPERATMFSALGKLYSLGHAIDWRSILPHDAQYLKLPAYPWQREVYWKESERSKQLRLGVGEHPLLGFRTQSAPPTWMLETPAAHLAYLDDHRVRGSAVYPMTAYLEAVAGAVRKLLPDRSFTLENVSIKKAIVFHADQATEIQVVIGADYSSFEVLSRQLEADWESNATGRIHTATSRPVPVTLDLAQLRARCPQEIASDAYYEALHQCGLDYGPRFRGIAQLWAGVREAVARIERPRNLEEDRYQIHPALLDSCLQTLMAAASWCWVDGTFNGGLFLPVSLDSIRMYGAPPETIWAHARAVPGTDPRQLRGNVQLLGGDGQLVAELRGVVCQAVGSAPPQRRHRDDLLYHYRWIPRPLQSEGNGCGEMPDPEQIAAIVRPEFSGWAESAQRRRYYEQLKPAMADLCVVYLLEMLDRLGHPLLAGERISTLALTDELGIATQHTKLFGRMIQILAEAGVLASSDGDWVVVGRQGQLSATALWRSLFERWPGFLAELTLLRRCGERLAEIVRGTIDPHHILFAPDSAPTLDHAYQDSPTVSLHNRAAACAIQSALARLPGDRPVRILEIGAGTGGSTAHILPVLPQARSQYVFTDVSQQFLSDAAQKFRQYPFVEYRKLDIEIDPVAQEFQEHAFDIVVATDALHATRDLRSTVENIRRLLASEGLLVLIEVTDAPLWFDLVFGTLEGWWLFQDYDLRPSHPLLNPRQWIGLLSEQGFSATGIYDAEEDHAEHTLLLARGPRLQQIRKLKTVDEITNGRWLIFADAGGVAESLSHRLAESGCEAVLVQSGKSYSRLPHAFNIEPGSSQDMARLVSELHDPSQVWEGIVFLWSLDVPVLDVPALSEGGDRAIEAAQMLACLPLVNLATALGQSRTTVRTGLWIVTSGAQGAGGLDDIRPAQALPWGLGRVLGNELPNLHPRLVDLSPNPSSEEVDGLFEELRYASEEDEIAFRRGTRYVNRLMSGDDESNQPSQADRPQGDRPQADRRAFYFEVETPGLVDTLVAVPLRRQPPPPGQVEIAVQAAPLNFRDVAKATGLLTKVNLPIGLECGGVVTAVGDGVTGLRAGDEVIAFASHALASHTTSDARFVARKPAHLSLEEAATALVAFATAHYGLVTCGQVMRGDTVLIHAATGGVGLAAIQVCHAAGAEVLATAGNADKRALLTALGVRHVMDSRSLDFAETVREITGGRGVDIVLNSLGGMAQSKSLSILAPCGRFVELGKRDIEQNTPLEMKHFQNNISFYAVDLDHLLGERPQQTCELIQQVGELLDQGIYRPLPYRVFPLTEAGNAFRFMAQGKHIGKVVISMQGGAPRRWQDASSALRFQENGTYLITGGLGGFSLEVARWMAERGAGCLVLASRSESVPPRRLAGVQAVQQFGSEVRLARCDVTDAAELERLLAEIRQSSRPLRGIIHAAMVLDDGPVTQMDLEQLTKVIQPKAAGAWNLHRLTIKDPLDFFVMFSSFAALMGNPGQANYAAGNLFLDALAHARKQQGLPALTVDWGALGEIGYVADTPRVAEYVKQLGVILLAPSDAMASLGYLLQSGATQAAVMAVDWDKLSNFASTDKPRFEHIAIQAQKRARGATSSGENGTASVPAAASDADRHGQLEGKLQGEMASLLGTTPSRVDVHVPLNNMGFDSLMAVTARHWIETEFGVDVPAVRFVEGISVRGLSEIILAREAKVVSR